jgi:hypothetical protein
MQAPPAGMIEAARDQVWKTGTATLEQQERELRSALGTVSEDFVSGYNLGLQTARMVIATSVQVQLARIDPDAIL